MNSESGAPIKQIPTNYNNSTYWFFIVTLIFFIFRIVQIPGNVLDKISIEKPQYSSVMDKLVTIIYISLVIMVMVYFNTDSIKQRCGDNVSSNNNFTIFLTTFFPWLAVFGMLYALLLAMPGWKSPFSNTFGYFITIYFMQGRDKLLSLLNKDGKQKNKYLINIIEDNSTTLINDYGPENIGKLKNLHNIDNAFYNYSISKPNIKSTYNELAKLIIIKDYISEFVWFLLTGVLVISITNNHLMEQNCA